MRYASEVERSLEDLEEPEEIQLYKIMPMIAEHLTVIQQTLMQDMVGVVRVEEKVKGIDHTIVVLKSQMNDLFSGQIQFTIQPITPILYEASSQP